MVHHPVLPRSEIEQERRLALEQLVALQDNPFQAAAVRMRELIYGDHPYGRPLPGTPGSLPLLGRAAVLGRHAATWSGSSLQIVVSGDLDEDRFLVRLESLLAGLPAASRPRLRCCRRPGSPRASSGCASSGDRTRPWCWWAGPAPGTRTNTGCP